MLSKFCFSFVVLTTGGVSASSILHTRHSSPISLPFTMHIDTDGGPSALRKSDRARLKTLNFYGSRQNEDALQQILLPARDSAMSYVANVGIGVPPTTYSLLIDTGSSNTWIGAGTPYQATPTSHKTNDSVSVTYGTGFFSGDEYLDTLTIGTASFTQSIGVASIVDNFPSIDGILGIGPTALTLGTLSPDNKIQIPTVMDNLKSQYFIFANVIGISFEPSAQHTSLMNGQLDFGGTNPSKLTGKIHYNPITSQFPYNHYWSIDQEIMYGNSTLVLTSSSAVIDTGTTLLYLPDEGFSRYVNATGAVLDTSVGLLTITAQQFHNLESMFFTIGGIKYEFTANAQIWPRALNGNIGGSPNHIYLIVANGGTKPISSINGFVWLQRFYSVFDTDNKRIGFANNHFTDIKPN